MKPNVLRMAMVFAMVSLTLACRPNPPAGSSSSQGGRSRLQRVGQSNVLFENTVRRLHDLPSGVDLNIRPPAVILDARTSADGRDVLATVAESPGASDGINNYLSVPAGNAGFRELGIRPGDIVKYFVIFDRETRERIQETGEADLVTMDSIDLLVAQVLDDNSIRIVGGLIQPVHVPARIEIWRVLDDRMNEINHELARYATRGEPAFGWEPSPDKAELLQIVERLNEWLHSRSGGQEWATPKLVGTLTPDLRETESIDALLSAEGLKQKAINEHEARYLQEAIWARDISNWAGKDALEPLSVARNLFDWTARNVTLTESPRVRANRPWQTLLYGRGTAAQRAWVFVQLCRQQKLPVALIYPARSEGQAPGADWLWCGVLVEDNIFLFDPQLGLEIPDAEGKGVATLAEVQQEESLLRSLDLVGASYPATSAQAQEATGSIVAEPEALAWRSRELQSKFSGQDALTLWVDVDSLAERFLVAGSLQRVVLWPAPFESVRRRALVARSRSEVAAKTRNAAAIDFRPFAWRPRLWKGRVLYFRGWLDSEESVKEKDELYDPVNDHQSAVQQYLHRSVRPTEKRLATYSANKQTIYRRAKIDATYWLGLLKYDQGDYRPAIEWLRSSVLKSEASQDRAAGVRYNLARAYEAQGDLEQAIALLEADDSPQSHGDRLRAATLRRKQQAASQASESQSND